jgi:hypothetical protein
MERLVRVVGRLDFDARVERWRRAGGRLRAPPDALDARGLGLLCLTAACGATLAEALFFPGLYTADSATQLGDAVDLLHAPGWHSVLIPLWYPPMMQLTMAAILHVSGAVWAIAWVQYALFLLSVLLLLTALTGRSTRAAPGLGLLMLLPPFWSLFIFVEATIWNAIGLDFVLAGVLLSGIADRRARSAVLALAAAGFVVLTGFRYNAIPLCLPAAILVLLTVQSGRARRGPGRRFADRHGHCRRPPGPAADL